MCPKCNSEMDERQAMCYHCGYSKRYIKSTNWLGNYLNVLIWTYKNSGLLITSLYLTANFFHAVFFLPYSLKERIRLHNMRRRGEQLEPPWLVFPDIPWGSIGWRMGNGESYIMTWDRWYKKLSQDDRAKYQSLHPAPTGLESFYKSRER